MLIRRSSTDLSEKLSREIEYQTKRGHTARLITMSPEAHEILRLLERQKEGAVLTQHDGIPVRVDKKMIGPRAVRVHYEIGTPVTEDMLDASKKSFNPYPRLIVGR